MLQKTGSSLAQDGLSAPQAADGIPAAQPLERRRLQSYLALILADMTALFAGFSAAGYLYLGDAGLAQASLLAQLVLPVFLTVALYNGAYSRRALEHMPSGALRAMAALAISAAVVVFIAFYTKSSAEFSRLLFTAGVISAAVTLAWTRAQMRAFIAWRCGASVINKLVIDDGGPRIDLPLARTADAARLGLVPDLDDPQALNRIGLILTHIDRVIVSCPPERRVAWATILKGANVEGEVIDDAVASIGLVLIAPRSFPWIFLSGSCSLSNLKAKANRYLIAQTRGSGFSYLEDTNAFETPPFQSSKASFGVDLVGLQT